MSAPKPQVELTVITKTYDLILWSCNHTGKFPRNHRFVLGERIERNLPSPMSLQRFNALPSHFTVWIIRPNRGFDRLRQRRPRGDETRQVRVGCRDPSPAF